MVIQEYEKQQAVICAYKKFAKFYDLYVGGFSLDLPLYLHFCNETNNILEVGCGTGRVLKSLAESGCKVLGVDISDEMLELAKIKLQRYISSGKIRLQNFDFSNAYLDETFDRVLVTFYTINYLLDDAVCRNFIGNIQRSMRNEGIIIIDLFYPGPLQKSASSDIWYEKEVLLAGKLIKLKDKRTMIGNVEERIQEYITADSSERIVTKRRFYSKQEMLRILGNSGFSNVEFTDGYNLNGFHRLKDSEPVASSFVVKAEKK